MIINDKEDKELFKNYICNAEINTTSCLAFVAMQKNDNTTHSEFKKLNIMCDQLDNLWDYANFCIDNDINIDISDYSYNLVYSLSKIHVEDYKSYYKNYGEFYHYYV